MQRLKNRPGSLQIISPKEKPWRYSLDKDEINIGRNPGNDLVIDHPTISRNHARLYFENGRWWIEDLVSRNGTFVNHNQIPHRTPVEIQSGVSLRLGDIRVVYRQSLPPYILWGALGISACIAIIVLLFAVLSIINRMRARQKTELGTCDQPALTVLTRGSVAVSDGTIPSPIPPDDRSNSAADPTQVVIFETALPGITPIFTPQATAPPSRPIISLAFMEMPFPYDGGNENFGGTLEQFRNANQRSSMGGRINSFFDHYFPLYPASNDPSIPGGQEPAEEPIGKNILLFTGENTPYDNYSGHPALDYSTYVHRQPTTPVFAVADGVITSAGEHTASGALFVRVKHAVPGVGDFQTTYWHLHPDEFYEAMLDRVGQNITAGTRVGTMGNTGWSTGHHLHFEVRFDRNRDGSFSSSEVVDPYGFIPSVDYPTDPWNTRAGLDSFYLWMHPLGVTAQVNENGAGQVDTGGTGGAGLDAEEHTTLCAPPGSLPPGGTVHISWSPDPPPKPDVVGTGHACSLSVLDANGQPVSEFSPLIEITIPFSEDDLEGIDPQTLAIYWKRAGTTSWQPLPTTLDFNKGLAAAYTDRPGQCALMGAPTRDVIQPRTIINAVGMTAPTGQFYDRVTVSLQSTDNEEVDRIEYSLDGGTTWLRYTGPFELDPGDAIPSPMVMDEEFFGGLPGTYLVLASATDRAGNVEDPPAYLQIGIDPSLKPQAPESPEAESPTPGATATATITPTHTPTPTSTEFTCAPSLTVSQNAFCRSGPGTLYDVITGYTPGTVLVINGQNLDETLKWWRVSIPNTFSSCWLSDSLVEHGEDAFCVQKLADPPTPTPSPTSTSTFTPTPTPTATPTIPTRTPSPTPIIIK